MLARFDGVRKKYGGKTIIKDMSFSIDRGEIIGLLGPNGSGKTTVMKLLSGMIFPDGGTIERGDNFRSLIETPCFYGGMSGYDNLLYFAALRGDGKEDVNEAVELLGMEGYIGKRVSKYSLGMRQKLGIACALLGKSELLILDEPVNGLDPLAVVEARGIFKDIRRQTGASILISSHILRELQELCGRVLLIGEGKIIGDVAVSRAEPSHIITFYSEADRASAVKLLGGRAEATASPAEIAVPEFCPVYKIVEKLVSDGVKITGVRRRDTDLEELYCNYFRGA